MDCVSGKKQSGCAPDRSHQRAGREGESFETLVVPRGEPFSLEHTLLSGQTFRWRKDDGGFVGVVSGNVLWLEQRRNRLLYRSLPGKVEPSELRTYLGLDAASNQALRSLPGDPVLGAAMRNFAGMRVLRQDPWETLVSFIISSNNNIVRIKRCIESLCRTFGHEIRGALGCYAFPSPDALAEASPDCLQQLCNLGYRHTYVRETAREVARSPGLLSDIARLSYLHARTELMRLPGVGPKVADCVLLYSMGKYEAFPVDTWVRKVMQRTYFRDQHVPDSAIRSFAADHFGPFAGYAQLYLFHSAREVWNRR